MGIYKTKIGTKILFVCIALAWMIAVYYLYWHELEYFNILQYLQVSLHFIAQIYLIMRAFWLRYEITDSFIKKRFFFTRQFEWSEITSILVASNKHVFLYNQSNKRMEILDGLRNYIEIHHIIYNQSKKIMIPIDGEEKDIKEAFPFET